jgi:D-proline reductase (dithiol) PrdB
VGLVASGGIYVKGQVAFHFKDDTSYREVSREVDYRDLRVTHFAYDLTDARADPNVVFPLQTLLSLAAEGLIGEVAPRAYTFMGGIYSARRVRDELAPALADRLQNDEVDAALLVPV